MNAQESDVTVLAVFRSCVRARNLHNVWVVKTVLGAFVLNPVMQALSVVKISDVSQLATVIGFLWENLSNP